MEIVPTLIIIELWYNTNYTFFRQVESCLNWKSNALNNDETGVTYRLEILERYSMHWIMIEQIHLCLKRKTGVINRLERYKMAVIETHIWIFSKTIFLLSKNYIFVKVFYVEYNIWVFCGWSNQVPCHVTPLS